MHKTTKSYKHKNKQGRKSKKGRKSKQNRKSKQSIIKSNINSVNLRSMTSLSDFTKNKSLSTLSNPTDIKSIISVGDFYNLLDIHDNINKNCINKVKQKVVDGIQLNKKVSKDICNCLFEKNKNLTIEKLEEKTTNKLHTPGSSCISILDKFISENKLQQTKINSKHSKHSKHSK